jgi:hypothetical protein
MKKSVVTTAVVSRDLNVIEKLALTGAMSKLNVDVLIEIAHATPNFRIAIEKLLGVYVPIEPKGFYPKGEGETTDRELISYDCFREEVKFQRTRPNQCDRYFKSQEAADACPDYHASRKSDISSSWKEGEWQFKKVFQLDDVVDINEMHVEEWEQKSFNRAPITTDAVEEVAMAIAHAGDMAPEALLSAMLEMKNDPTLSIQDALVLGLAEWIK